MRIAMVAESNDGQIKRSAFELAGVAKQLAANRPGTSVCVYWLGHGLANLAAQLNATGIVDCKIIDDPQLKNYHAHSYAHALHELIRQDQPTLVLGSASLSGRDYLPRVAAMSGMAMISDATAFSLQGEKVHWRRPVFA